MQYNHTQTGRLMIAVLILTTLLFTGIYFAGIETFEPSMIALMIFILFIVSSFITLNVRMDGEYLRLKFGYGVFKRKFRLSEIVSVKAVRQHWYYGWGIRYWVPSSTWIYNVSGYDQVEIVMKDGKKYRIGTDEPQELERVILGSVNK